MSHGQTKVSEYYSKRKKYDGLQPSKRRKVIVNEDVETTTDNPFKSPPIGARTRSRISKVSHPTPGHLNVSSQKTKTARQSKSKSKVPIKPANQKTIAEVLSNVSKRLETAVQPDAPVQNNDLLTDSIPTEACDNHNVSPPGTPTKRRQNPKQVQEETTVISNKRSRCKKVARKDLFQEEANPGFNFDNNAVIEERKVVSPRRRSTDDEEKTVVFQFKGQQKDPVKEARIQKLAEDVFRSTKESEPSPETSAPKQQSADAGPVMEKLKSQTSVALKKDPAAMKAKLQQVTSLADLKAKLKAIRPAASPKKKVREVTVASPVKSRLLDIVKDTKISAISSPSVKSPRPAYERFTSLDDPIPPGLTLPKHYKLLQDQFNSTDTVVAMLHKRAEICTFNKIKPAVQQMTSKNFDLRNLGQIKTIYPSAYEFKQEKNLPCYGKKKSNDYQLTIEANLVNDPLSKNCDVKYVTKDGRPDFMGSTILERKSTFHRRLINILRKHHREFLTSIERPINVADHKVTRWHPKFLLDTVPEVEVADLPKPQTGHVITTAKEALEHAKEKFNNPRVIQALEKVVAANAENNDEKNKTPKKCQLPGTSPKTNSNTAIKNSPKPKTNTPLKSADNQALKGVSMSFLEKIRAKEARKQEESMLRTPADEKKKERMSRLPELVRIIRNLFVTSKKPALLQADVLEKVTDSYTACMGQAEAECHLKLMVELVPDWLSVVTLKRGIFITINKNQDINVVIEALNKKRAQLP